MMTAMMQSAKVQPGSASSLQYTIDKLSSVSIKSESLKQFQYWS